ncbi:MAG: UDP-N-acetylmuramoyl-tripeptide--D-alanyl-D-alanine ligase [Bacteroidales bacterium]|nr:UDP-N-acetylmuramoyl-tripeptide--D-alanyl-D-alanine ligase [Bacteroidales bacterium]
MDLRGEKFNVEKLYKLFQDCKGYTTDTREIAGGEMFFALKGDNFDANEFAAHAVERGAKYCVVDNIHVYENSGEELAGKLIAVDDTLTAFRAMAKYHRSRFDIPVIGITGTNGKTTTKEMVNAVLSAKYKVTCTKGNRNNHIGVPMTLLEITPDTEIAVVEMGANHPGEITASVELAMPTHGLITNVGQAHLEGFGSFEGVMKTKGELYDWLSEHGGIAFYDADNEYLSEMVTSRKGMQLMPYGVEYAGMRVLKTSRVNPYLTMEIEAADVVSRITTRLIGSYNATNVAAALTVGGYFEVDFDAAVAAIEAYVPSNSRSQLIDTGRNIVILDAYNANASSMNAALDNFASTSFPNKVLVLGDMLELGKFSAEAHSQILAKARKITSEIYLVGASEFKAVAREGDLVFDTSLQLKEYFRKLQPEGKTILIKGSNATRLPLIMEVL